jgi:hypothetical protein
MLWESGHLYERPEGSRVGTRPRSALPRHHRNGFVALQTVHPPSPLRRPITQGWWSFECDASGYTAPASQRRTEVHRAGQRASRCRAPSNRASPTLAGSIEAVSASS